MWIAAAAVAGWALFFIAIFNLNAFRQLVVFLFSMVQIGAVVVIVLTLHMLRGLLRRQEDKTERLVLGSVTRSVL